MASEWPEVEKAAPVGEHSEVVDRATVGNGAAKEEGTREGLVLNTGFLCLTRVFPEVFFPGLDSRFRVSGWQRSHPGSVLASVRYLTKFQT